MTQVHLYDTTLRDGMQGQGMSSTEPAPAPMDHYPVCKPGQYDKCMERGSGSSMSGHRMTRHHMKARHHMTMRHHPAKKMVHHTKTTTTTSSKPVLGASSATVHKTTNVKATHVDARGNTATHVTKTGKTITYDCSKAGNKTKTACKK